MPEEKLNIAHLHWGFPPIIGGVETHLTIIMPQMVECGHNVSLLTGSANNVPAESEYMGAHVSRTPIMDLNWLDKRGLNGLDDEIANTYSAFFDRCKPDVIHAHNMHYFSQPHARILERIAGERGLPLVLTAHNVWDELLFLELTKKIKWSHIIAVSHFIKREIIGIGVNDVDITVVHHGLDEKKFSPGCDTSHMRAKYPKLEGRRIVFHPARIGLAKGCDISIKAMNIVKEMVPDSMLVLAGSKNIIDWGGKQQKDIAYLVNLIKHLELEDDILIDMYTLDEVRELYELSEVCVYPSTGPEPFGLTMIEAMAMEKPMVVTNMGGMPEIIKDGINGFVIPVRDFESLAAKITHLLKDEKMNKRFGYTGRQIVEASYTREKVTRDTIAVYKRVIKKMAE